jgi:hypothetical protein
MGKVRTSYELEFLAKKAKAREDAKLAARKASPKPYTPKSPQDYQTYYYRDPIDLGRVIEIPQVNVRAINLLGGEDDAGLLVNAPSGTTNLITLYKGSKIKIIKLHWYFGDATATAVTTDWGTRYIKKYDAQGGQSHFSVPFTIASGTFNLETIMNKFRTYFVGEDATKKALIGELGRAELRLGREVLLSAQQ